MTDTLEYFKDYVNILESYKIKVDDEFQNTPGNMLYISKGYANMHMLNATYADILWTNVFHRCVRSIGKYHNNTYNKNLFEVACCEYDRIASLLVTNYGTGRNGNLERFAPAIISTSLMYSYSLNFHLDHPSNKLWKSGYVTSCHGSTYDMHDIKNMNVLFSFTVDKEMKE